MIKRLSNQKGSHGREYECTNVGATTCHQPSRGRLEERREIGISRSETHFLGRGSIEGRGAWIKFAFCESGGERLKAISKIMNFKAMSVFQTKSWFRLERRNREKEGKDTFTR